MKLLIDCWKETFKLKCSKDAALNLAEKSADFVSKGKPLWSIDSDDLGTKIPRTLNKYIDINKLPDHPKLDVIEKTMNFILKRISTNHDYTKRITVIWEEISLYKNKK